jgi:hypothetical protein
MNSGSEEWRTAVGFPKYEVSADGRVRRATPSQGATVGRILPMRPGRSGYLTVKLGRSTVSVHRLVCLTFIGPPPTNKHEVNHKDRNRLNARVSNLEWTTRSENMRHAYANGAVATCGEQRPSHKLTWHEVAEIRQSPATLRALARQYGVCHKTIGQIKKGVKWPDRPTIVEELR